ncbi:COX15/CtaA family protein [Myxococcota bacterium]|nr:COX15/CtaA family protein [Myxococcota bacterium]
MTPPETAPPESPPPRAVAHWLLALYALVGLMVAVGGITRLTGSGLSITEWKPVVGALPPLNEADWQRAFDLYQASPQFQQINHWMSLSDFKGIYFWEWFHRLLGRFIGVAFFVPWLVFLVRGHLRGAWARRTAVAFVLGGLQGALGWFMVASGLVDVPQVSHYRLAAHLSLAFFVGMYLLWLWLDLRGSATPPGPERAEAASAPPGMGAFVAFLALLAVQIVYGAFMAGSRAGYLFQTFPDMNGLYVVTGDAARFLNDPVGIHFVHRALGWAVGFAGLALAFRLRAWASGRWLGALVVVQFALGVATVMTAVDLTLAVAHQLGAWALLSAAVVALHRRRRG